MGDIWYCVPHPSKRGGDVSHCLPPPEMTPMIVFIGENGRHSVWRPFLPIFLLKSGVIKWESIFKMGVIRWEQNVKTW